MLADPPFLGSLGRFFLKLYQLVYRTYELKDCSNTSLPGNFICF